MILVSHPGLLHALILLITAYLCQATITITETGEHFASHPDRAIGTRFLEGYEYLARLQVFTQDLHLCPSPSNPHFNLTVDVPPDGLPVAILARSGGCSIETMARLASFAIQPPQKVKYLVVYGTDSQSLTPPRKARIQIDPDISVGVLYVSERSGHELLRTIAEQSNKSRNEGGPRILLDGRNYQDRYIRDVVSLWIGVAIMMMACLFSFLLSIRAQQEGLRNAVVTVAREPPRRLTRQQVVDLLEEYSPDEALLQHGDACSICLDDYESGDKCCSLPCGHDFHCGCISKWLIERSSTCPLCKSDVLGEDEEEESDDEYIELRDGGTQTRDEGGAVFLWMDRVIDRIRNRRTSWWRRRRGSTDVREQQASVGSIADGEEEGVVSRQPLLQEDEREFVELEEQITTRS